MEANWTAKVRGVSPAIDETYCVFRKDRANFEITKEHKHLSGDVPSPSAVSQRAPLPRGNKTTAWA